MCTFLLYYRMADRQSSQSAVYLFYVDEHGGWDCVQPVPQRKRSARFFITIARSISVLYQYQISSNFSSIGIVYRGLSSEMTFEKNACQEYVCAVAGLATVPGVRHIYIYTYMYMYIYICLYKFMKHPQPFCVVNVAVK